ncbi:MAG: hypothetical protein KGY69_19405 [Bacteroidales bacterium]|nr:hypothetical protein [Bacteroidales bacterium]
MQKYLECGNVWNTGIFGTRMTRIRFIDWLLASFSVARVFEGEGELLVEA